MSRLQSAVRAVRSYGHGVLALLVVVGAMFGATTVGAAQDDRPTVAIGSKEFTEQQIINEVFAQLLEEAGYEVERQFGLGGTAIVHEALVSGDVDLYVEYTGTGLVTILDIPVDSVGTPEAAGTPAAGSDAVYETVKREYRSRFDLVWLDPLGFDNTYVLAMTEERATELGVASISDLIDVAGDLTFGGTQEFLTRPDGLPGLTEAYEGLEFGDEQGFDAGLVYQAVDGGDVDVISAFSTDGRIFELGLVTLEDDLGFFPPYFAAPVVRQDLLDESPEVEEVLNQLAGQIDNETIAGLNLQVDEGGEEPEDVARAFLEERGLVGAS